MAPLRPLFDLSGQVAIVTGGSRGLGGQIVEALAEFGARVVMVARKADELANAAADLRDHGLEVDFIATDISLDGAADRIVGDTLKRFGRLDILVNAAGTTWGAPAAEHPREAWDKVFELNVNAAFRLIQAAGAQAMIPQRRGKIINVASIAGILGYHPQKIGTIAYSTSKGAVIQMTRALAAEWAPYGINVNAIAPGYFPTRMTAKVLNEGAAGIIAETPLGRLGNSVDLKGPVLLLATAAGGYITGQTLVVDGGVSII